MSKQDAVREFQTVDVEQRSTEWLNLRCGKVTASRVADVIAKTKTGVSASRGNYLAQLVAERMTGQPSETYSNASMQWGTDTEPLARAAYEAHTGELVTEVGFVHHPVISFSGASPDGFVGGNLIEIKCPNTATHIDHLLSGNVPTKYIPQMQWQMACTGSDWCDFVSFDPRMPEKHQLFIVRCQRDNDYISMLESEVKQFLSEVQDTINKLNERG